MHRKALASSGLFLLFALLARGAESPPSSRRYVDFDPDWRFSVGNSPMAMQSKFDDSAWRQLSVPHDWSIEGPFRADYASGNGYAPGGIGWYRKHFRMDPADRGRQVTLELDGVYDHAEVWLNGFLVGGRPSGYEPITCDLTPLLKFGAEENIVAVRVDHSRLSDSRWYTGAGIYRDVRLCVTSPLHLGAGGTYVTTPVVGASAATVRVETSVENGAGRDRTFTLQSDLLAPDGRIVATVATAGTLANGRDQTFAQELTLAQPALWSPEAPTLYTLRSRLVADGAVEDETATAFGVRTLQFDPDRGFFLNGVATKFRGVCIHQDGGSVGVAVPLPVWERRLQRLKSLGVNAIRTSHNPPASGFLDLCDRLGFLVMDEAFDEYTPAKNKWVEGWNQGVPSRFGYSESFAEWSVRDIRDMVRRDRNHPSVVMWSIGNEIDYPNDPFTDPALGAAYRPGNPPGTDLVKWGRPLVAAVKQLDPTRPVTAALASVAMSNAVGFAQILDLAGYNYQEPRYADDHREFPRRVIYGSENKHDYASWLAVRDNPMISGQFLWTGIDYLGEARAWPARANPDGLLDLCGFIKPLGRFRQSLWSTQPMVALAVGDQESWNWPDQSPRTVSCFTNCAEVTLTLNGQPLGTKRLAEAEAGVLRWQVPFAPGELKAVGSTDGRALCEFALRTAGPASRIELKPDVTGLRADGRDVAQVEFTVVDAQGVRVPDAAQELTFVVAGPGQIIGIGNGDITNREPVRGPDHRADQGRGLALVQSTTVAGPIVLTVSAPGLLPATVTLAADQVAAKPLFRDPVYDGAADPTIIWNSHDRKWYMLYTVRRANVPGLNGVAWVHGTPLGIATSSDGGATWQYLGEAKINYPAAVADKTYWAPAVVEHAGIYHMYVVYVPGTFADGWNHPRDILHLTSRDLVNWDYQSILPLAHHKDIDAGILHLPDGTWRLWYKDEADGSACHFADSPDLSHWTDRGKSAGLSDRSGEAPLPFHWKGHYWLMRDITGRPNGLALYRSEDALAWSRVGTLLQAPGTGPDDQAVGHHPEVIISNDRAYLFYFTHPDARGTSAVDGNARRSSIQVAELKYDPAGPKLTCDRDRPTLINLQPPADPETESKFN